MGKVILDRHSRHFFVANVWLHLGGVNVEQSQVGLSLIKLFNHPINLADRRAMDKTFCSEAFSSVAALLLGGLPVGGGGDVEEHRGRGKREGRKEGDL